MSIDGIFRSYLDPCKFTQEICGIDIRIYDYRHNTTTTKDLAQYMPAIIKFNSDIIYCINVREYKFKCIKFRFGDVNLYDVQFNNMDECTIFEQEFINTYKQHTFKIVKILIDSESKV